MGKAKTTKDTIDVIKELNVAKKQLYSLRRSNGVGNVLQIAQSGNSGQSVASTSNGNFLSKAGDAMDGPLGFNRTSTTVLTSSKILDVSDSGTYSTYIRLSNASGFDLETISGNTFIGQLIILQGLTGQTTPIVTTGNIDTIDGTTFNLVGRNHIIIIYDDVAGRWVQITGGSASVGAFANQSLSNLTNPTSINQDLIPSNDGLTDVGSFSFFWDNLYTRRMLFKDDKSVDATISGVGADSNRVWFNQTLANGSFEFLEDGVDRVRFEMDDSVNPRRVILSDFRLDIEGATSTDYVRIEKSDSGQSVILDTNSNGEDFGYQFRIDGFTRMSILGTGAVGGGSVKMFEKLDMEANNIEDTGHILTAIANTNDIGATATSYRDLFINNIKFGSSANKIVGSSSLISVELGTSDNFLVTVGSTPELTITTDSIQIGSQTTDDLGFMGTPPIAKQTVTGSRSGNAALASLLTALASYGIITNSTSA